MDIKNYLDSQIEQDKENRNKQFEEKQSKKYGQSEWLEQAYNREMARLQPIIDAINASPNHTITINGYTCKKHKDEYHLGVSKHLVMRNDNY